MKRGERLGMTCSKRPQVSFEHWPTAVRTQPLYMGRTLKVFKCWSDDDYNSSMCNFRKLFGQANRELFPRVIFPGRNEGAQIFWVKAFQM